MFGCLSHLENIPSMTAPSPPTTYEAANCRGDEIEQERNAPAPRETDDTLEVGAAGTRPRSTSLRRRVAIPSSQRPSVALSLLLPYWPRNESNNTSSMELLLRGIEYQATPSREGPLTTMPRPVFSRDYYHEPRGGGRDELRSFVDPARQELLEYRPAAPRRRRDRAAESESQHERSVRQRALRALLDDVLGDFSAGVSDNDAFDFEARRG